MRRPELFLYAVCVAVLLLLPFTLSFARGELFTMSTRDFGSMINGALLTLALQGLLLAAVFKK